MMSFCCYSAFITSLSGETKDNLLKISGFNEWLAVRLSISRIKWQVLCMKN